MSSKVKLPSSVAKTWDASFLRWFARFLAVTMRSAFVFFAWAALPPLALFGIFSCVPRKISKRPCSGELDNILAARGSKLKNVGPGLTPRFNLCYFLAVFYKLLFFNNIMQKRWSNQ
nr:MAG TPA: hypothetical protein [Caudoviricetes sp.]